MPPDVILFGLKCTKFDFGWGSAPDPAGGAYSAPPDGHLKNASGTSASGASSLMAKMHPISASNKCVCESKMRLMASASVTLSVDISDLM